MIEGSKTKAEGKPQGKPKENDVICLSETYYNGKRLDAGTVIPNFKEKFKGYGRTAPASEAHKYKKKLFNGEPRLVLKKEKEE
jgi:hypothetical protein